MNYDSKHFILASDELLLYSFHNFYLYAMNSVGYSSIDHEKAN